MTQTGVIERHDRAHGGEVATYIQARVAESASNSEIAAGLLHIFGIDVNRTTVLRYLRRNPSTTANAKPTLKT